ncbi:MAG: amidohydrolase, partial [Acidimicrobiales bacterium]
MQLIDHHVHGVVRGVLEQPAFELFINEGGWPALPGTSHFDTPLGLAIRRWCAPVLDLEPLVAGPAYLERRAALGDEANRRLMRAAAGGGVAGGGVAGGRAGGGAAVRGGGEAGGGVA